MGSCGMVSVKSATRYDGLLDVLQMLSGATLALFVCMHMLFLSSVLFGAASMNGLSTFLESMHAERIGGVVITLVFLFHMTVTARRIPFRAAQAIDMLRHARLLHHADTWRWIVQVLTAFALLVLVTIHLWEGMRYLPVMAVKSAMRIQAGPWGWFYLVLLPVLFVHLAIGVWRIGVKWGVVTSARRAVAVRWERYLLGGFLGLALLTLLRLWTLPLQ